MRAQDLQDVDYSTIKPGETVDLKIKLQRATNLKDDVDHELLVLNNYKSQSFQDSKLSADLESHIAELTALQNKLNSQIDQITSQLDKIPSQVRDLFDRLSRECSSYIKSVKSTGQWLYRGADEGNPDVYVGKSWLDRRPSDSHPQAQKLFDQILAMHGLVALRGNSIFATSDQFHASEFGKVYVIFPVDHHSHFTYTTSRDLAIETPEDLLSERKSQEWLSQLRKWMREYEKQKGWDPSNSPVRKVNLLSLLDLNDEWTRHGLDLAELPERFRNMNLIDLVDIQEFMQEYQPSSRNLGKAIEHMVEVYVSGIYYAVDAEKYDTFLETYFGVPVAKWY